MLLRDFMQDNVTLTKGSVKLPIGGFIANTKDKYLEMKKNTSKPFLHMSYLVTPGDTLTVHVKVPSKSLKKFYYDVLFELVPINGAKTIEDCHVKIFSNSPSFVYSYAYVFYHLDPDSDGVTSGSTGKSRKTPGMLINRLYRKIPMNRLLIPGTENKYGDRVLNEPPVIRNPYNLPLFDSSLYLAIHYLEDTTTLQELMQSAKRITEKQLLANVDDFDHLMEARKRTALTEGREEQKKKRISKEVVQTVERETRRANAVRVIKPKSPISARKAVSALKPLKPKSTR